MVSKRRRLLLIAIPAVYVGAFFLWVPAHMAAVRWHAYWLIRPIDGYDLLAYRWWIDRMPGESWIVKVRGANSKWWCYQFSTCTVQEQ